jgi:hypothetical protein
VAGRHYPELASVRWLHTRYVDEVRSCRNIAGLLGCDSKTVSAALRRHGITARQRTAPGSIDHDWLQTEYVGRGRSLRSLADEFGCSTATIWKALGEAGIVARSRGRSPVVGLAQRYGRLTVIAEANIGPRGRRYRCRCACGKELEVDAGSLRSGNSQSCGCLRLDAITTHGLSGHPLYQTWHDMHDRCSNPANTHWQWYGGRGIAVCARWSGRIGLYNFTVDMGRKPSPSHSIDRIDVNGNYEPTNCRWATWKQQAANRRPAEALERRRKERTNGK